MAKKNLDKYNIILASKSPRRQYLLKQIGIVFSIKTKEVNESFPKKLKGKAIAVYLAQKKAEAFHAELKPKDLLITSDTIVCIGDKVLNKPANPKEAAKMLGVLSGKTHTVYTAVCLYTLDKSKTFVDATKVTFKKLAKTEIEQYIEHFKPFDKAGSYGAQETLPIGMNPCSKEELAFLKKIKCQQLIQETVILNPHLFYVQIIKKISGSYFNVMGLPILKLFTELNKL